MPGVSGISAVSVLPFGGSRGYIPSGGSMDFWYAVRMPINAANNSNPVIDWPVWYWDRQAIPIYVGP